MAGAGLAVTGGRLTHHGAPLDGLDYLLIEIQAATTRDDWSFPQLDELFREARAAAVRGEKPRLNRLREDLIVLIHTCADLTHTDRKRVAAQIKEELEEVGRGVAARTPSRRSPGWSPNAGRPALAGSPTSPSRTCCSDRTGERVNRPAPVRVLHFERQKGEDTVRNIDDADAWLDQWTARSGDQAARANRLARQVADLTVRAESRDGDIAVTVDSTGRIVDLRLDGHGSDLAREILAVMRTAQHRLTGLVTEQVRDTVGADSATGRAVMDSFQQRFPEPPEAPDGRR